MPCYTVSEAKLDIGMRKANIDALKAGLTSLGFKLVDSYVTGQTKWVNGNDTVTFDREEGLVVKSYSNVDYLGKQINQSYTDAVVQMTAKKFGWQVQTKSSNQFLVTKR